MALGHHGGTKKAENSPANLEQTRYNERLTYERKTAVNCEDEAM